MKFPPDTRAEELDVDQLVELSNRLQRRVQGETLKSPTDFVDRK